MPFNGGQSDTDVTENTSKYFDTRVLPRQDIVFSIVRSKYLKSHRYYSSPQPIRKASARCAGRSTKKTIGETSMISSPMISRSMKSVRKWADCRMKCRCRAHSPLSPARMRTPPSSSPTRAYFQWFVLGIRFDSPEDLKVKFPG